MNRPYLRDAMKKYPAAKTPDKAQPPTRKQYLKAAFAKARKRK